MAEYEPIQMTEGGGMPPPPPPITPSPLPPSHPSMRRSNKSGVEKSPSREKKKRTNRSHEDSSHGGHRGSRRGRGRRRHITMKRSTCGLCCSMFVGLLYIVFTVFIIIAVVVLFMEPSFFPFLKD